jgi:lysozyme family protein
MNPLAIAVPVIAVGGVAAYYFLTRPKADLTPLPGAAAVTSGGARAEEYLKRLKDANTAISMAKVIGGDTLKSASTEAAATLDVVGTMAAVDAAQGRITSVDLANINAQIAAVKKNVG